MHDISNFLRKGIKDILKEKNEYSEKLLSVSNAIIVFDLIKKQEDLINFYHNKNLFLAIMNLSYFLCSS